MTTHKADPLPLPKPQGALAAMFVGMLYLNEEATLQLSCYKPQLIDTAKLDMLSPPWMRLSQPKASASLREAKPAAKLAEMVASFARYYAQQAVDEVGIGAVAKVVVKRLPCPEHGGQVGLSCSLRLEGDMMAPSDLASAWGKIFMGKMRSALARRKESMAEWSDAPVGLARSAQLWSMELSMSESEKELMSLWPQALLAVEELREIHKAAPQKRERKPQSNPPPKKQRL
jgi:hypothetical protein